MAHIKKPLTMIAVLMLDAQASDWRTFGGDAQRTGWAKTEKILTKDSLKSFGLDWKLHLD